MHSGIGLVTDDVQAKDAGTAATTLPIAFGPVLSRRLGWSLGVNNVPPKTCTYACVYCQVGATDKARIDRTPFVEPAALVMAVRERLAECSARRQPVDYVTFVPDGEPTLDSRLGAEITGLAGLGARVAILTNGSLLWRRDVREEVALADCVSLKVDTVHEPTWRRLNRPIGGLEMARVLAGMRSFARVYRGVLLTETLLVAGVNDDEANLASTTSFVAELRPQRAYITVPTRPPAESWVRAAAPPAVRRMQDLLDAAGITAISISEEIDESAEPFAASVNPAQGLLGIVAVHPMTEEAVRAYLARSGADWSVAQSLLDAGRIVAITYAGYTYLRAAHRRQEAAG
jgi:wyosine [tRNA(Phe)-imidazoG37] synthetase (radical SAM superfamily)